MVAGVVAYGAGPDSFSRSFSEGGNSSRGLSAPVAVAAFAGAIMYGGSAWKVPMAICMSTESGPNRSTSFEYVAVKGGDEAAIKMYSATATAAAAIQ